MTLVKTNLAISDSKTQSIVPFCFFFMLFTFSIILFYFIFDFIVKFDVSINCINCSDEGCFFTG